MSTGWAVRLPLESAAAAGALRLRSGLEVHPATDGIWLRGGELSEDLERALRKLPGAERFSVLPEGSLIAHGRRVPQGRLPAGEWMALREWFRPFAPAGALPAEVVRRAVLRLERTTVEGDQGVLVADFAAWAEWAVGAPAVRLRPLVFAASGDGRVAVRGRPLPPIPGLRCVERDGIAIPCGYAVRPAVESAVLRARLGLAAGDLAIFAADGTWEAIRAAAFVKARREAVRAPGSAIAQGAAPPSGPGGGA